RRAAASGARHPLDAAPDRGRPDTHGNHAAASQPRVGGRHGGGTRGAPDSAGGAELTVPAVDSPSRLCRSRRPALDYWAAVAVCIACLSGKGGVEKTPTCASLAAVCAERRRRVLAVDMDPQSNLT